MSFIDLETFLDAHNGAVTAIATIVIAMFTVALAIVSWYQARITKKTIDLAREEFISTHRPKIVIRKVFVKSIQGKGVMQEPLGIEFTIANIGDTAAKIMEISTLTWMPTKEEYLPATPPYAEYQPVKIPIKSGEAIPYTHYEHSSEVINNFWQNIGYAEADATPAQNFLFLGYIDYIDERVIRHRTAFLRKYDFTTGRFDPINHPDYEYQD